MLEFSEPLLVEINVRGSPDFRARLGQAATGTIAVKNDGTDVSDASLSVFLGGPDTS